MNGETTARKSARATPRQKSPDTRPSEPESSPVSKSPPQDIYDVPGTPVKSKGRTNGVRSARKQAPSETPRPASQTSPEPVPQVSPEPALQETPKPEVQAPPEPAPPQEAPMSKPHASVTPKKGVNSAPARIYYQFSFQIEKGDWVVRLRDTNAPKLDKDDTWDGPFQVQELPRANVENDDSRPTLVKLKLPIGSTADPWTDFKRLLPVHSVADTPTRGVLHLSKDTSTYLDLAMKFKPKSRKERDMFTVGKLRDRRIEKDGAVKYLVHWAEYPDEDDSWEGEEGIPQEFKEVWEAVHGTGNGDGGDVGGSSSGARNAAMMTPAKSGREVKRREHSSPGDSQGQEGSIRKRRRTTKSAAT